MKKEAMALKTANAQQLKRKVDLALTAAEDIHLWELPVASIVAEIELYTQQQNRATEKHKKKQHSLWKSA